MGDSDDTPQKPGRLIHVKTVYDLDTGRTTTTAEGDDGLAGSEGLVIDLQRRVAGAVRAAMTLGDFPAAESALAAGESQAFLEALPLAATGQDAIRLGALVQKALALETWRDMLPRIVARAAYAFLKGKEFAQAREFAAKGVDLAEATSESDTAAFCLIVAGNGAAAMGQRLEARRWYERALARYLTAPSDQQAWALWNLGKVDFADEQYARARSCWVKAAMIWASHGNKHQPMQALGTAAKRLEIADSSEALALWLDALHAAPAPGDDPSQRSLIGNLELEAGRLLLDDLGDAEAAVPHLEQALSYLKAGILEDAESYSTALLLAGTAYASVGDAGRATACASERERYLAARPNLPDALIERALRGELAAGAKDDSRERIASLFAAAAGALSTDEAKALGHLDDAISKLRDDDLGDRALRSHLVTYAASILWKHGQHELAIAYQLDACHSYPSNLRARTQLAQFLHNRGRCQEAFEIGVQIARTQPKSHFGFLIAGAAALKAGDFGPAVPLLEEALRLRPGRSDIAAALEKARQGNSLELVGERPLSAKLAVASFLETLPPTGHMQFQGFLQRFADRLAKNSDVFWASRSHRKWNPSPEKIGSSLLTQDLAAHGRLCRTYREVSIGGGRIDLVANILGQEYVLELKMCGPGYSRDYAEGGFEQLKGYMRLARALRGYLVVFDGRVQQSGADAIPPRVDLGDGMIAFGVGVNVLGIEAR